MSDRWYLEPLWLQPDLSFHLCAGIDVDIDVEHEGQRSKVTPPFQNQMEDDMEGGAHGGDEVKSDCGTIEGTKVRWIYWEGWSLLLPLISPGKQLDPMNVRFAGIQGL